MPFISLLISLCLLQTLLRFPQISGKLLKRKKKVKSPFLLVPFRVVNCHSLSFCASHSWFCVSISLFAVSAIQFSACIVFSCFFSPVLSQPFQLFSSWSYRSFGMICFLSICPVRLPFTLYLNLLLCLLSLFSSLSVCLCWDRVLRWTMLPTLCN